MKKNILMLMFFINLVSAQTGFSVEFEAYYKLNYLDDKRKFETKETAFTLLINRKASYFKNINKYISDSLKFEKKLTSSGDKLKDATEMLKYLTDFNENIGITDNKIYVSVNIENIVYEYEEKNNLTWKIHNEIKKINNYTCQKATTVKYGRTWTAYFTTEIPFPFGPHKFSNLPGLIIELYDDKKHYHFSLYKFQKRKYYCKSANMNKNSIKVQKDKVFDYRRKQIGDASRFQQSISDSETLTILLKNISERTKNYNPIELSPL